MRKQRLIVCDFLPTTVSKIRKCFPFAYYDAVFCDSIDKAEAEAKAGCDKLLVVTAENRREVENACLKFSGVTKEKLIQVEEYMTQGIKYPFCRFCFGEKNKGKTFYVMIPEPANGLFYLMNYFIRQIELAVSEKFLPVVDMKYHKSLYIEADEIGQYNAWENYFSQMTDVSLEEVYDSADVIIGSSDMNSFSYEGFTNRRRVEIYRSYFHETPTLLSRFQEEKKRVFGEKKGVLGVICRGTDYANGYRPHAHAIPYDAYELCEMVRKYLSDHSYSYVYLATEDSAALEVFRNHFGDKLMCSSQRRYSDDGDRKLVQILSDAPEKRSNNAYLLGEEYYLSIALLACCDSMVGTHCAGLRAAITLNEGRYKDVIVTQKGRYGLNGEHPLIVERVTKNLVALTEPGMIIRDGGITLEAASNGSLNVNGLALRNVRMSIREREETYLPAGEYVCSLKVPDGIQLTFSLFDANGKETVVVPGSKTSISTPVVEYSIKMAVNFGTKVNGQILLMFENACGTVGEYQEHHTSITEIALKDSSGKFHVLKKGETINITQGVIRTESGVVPLAKEELAKYHAMVRYPDGLVRFRYRGSYIGTEQVCIEL